MKRSTETLVLAVTLGCVLVGAGCSEATENAVDASSEATASTSASTTSTMTPDQELALALAAIETYNMGDFDAYLEHFAEDALMFGGVAANREDVRADFEFFAALGDHVEVTRTCKSVVAGSVTCGVTVTDDLSEAVGLSDVVELIFQFDGELIASLSWVGDHGTVGKQEFVHAMANWVEQSHPDVWESALSTPDCDDARYDCWGGWTLSQAAAAALLDLGPEYRETVGNDG